VRVLNGVRGHGTSVVYLSIQLSTSKTSPFSSRRSCSCILISRSHAISISFKSFLNVLRHGGFLSFSLYIHAFLCMLKTQPGTCFSYFLFDNIPPQPIVEGVITLFPPVLLSMSLVV